MDSMDAQDQVMKGGSWKTLIDKAGASEGCIQHQIDGHASSNRLIQSSPCCFNNKNPTVPLICKTEGCNDDHRPI
jgi:hypothetical protein